MKVFLKKRFLDPGQHFPLPPAFLYPFISMRRVASRNADQLLSVKHLSLSALPQPPPSQGSRSSTWPLKTSAATEIILLVLRSK